MRDRAWRGANRIYNRRHDFPFRSMLFKNGRRLGIEIKRADAPTLTPSMRSAIADLKLEQLIVLYPGSQPYELEPRVRVLPIGALAGATVEAMFPKKHRKRAAPEVR